MVGISSDLISNWLQNSVFQILSNMEEVSLPIPETHIVRNYYCKELKMKIYLIKPSKFA